jgi:hypothetical protein
MIRQKNSLADNLGLYDFRSARKRVNLLSQSPLLFNNSFRDAAKPDPFHEIRFLRVSYGIVCSQFNVKSINSLVL